MKKEKLDLIEIRKGENGSITMFVIVIMVFFILALTGMFLAIKNKENSMEKDLEQIQQSYGQNTNNITEVYQELTNP